MMRAPHESPDTLYTLARQGLAGAGGGLLAFFLREPQTLAAESRGLRTGDLGAIFAEAMNHAVLMGGFTGALIAAALVFGDELGSGSGARIARRTSLGLLVGGALGAVAGIAGQFLMWMLLLVGILPLARAGAWSLVGAGVGLAGGLAAGSLAKGRQGLLGGAVGGLAGGILFDLLGAITQQGTVSRLVGMALMGACTGVAAAMAEEIAKQAWFTVLTGSGEGRRYVLNKPAFTIGRAELADLPLFGDASLDRTQAIARPADGGYMIEEVGQSPLLRVDGQPATSGWLRDGSLLELGRHRLRFSTRGTAGSAGGPFSTPAPPLLPLDAPPLLQGSDAGNPAGWQAAEASWPADVPAELGIVGASPGGAIRLRAEAGPHAGAVFPVPPGGGRLGRAPENAISLSADVMASRQHAEIFPEGGGWVLRDLESRNGTMVNGEVVAEAWIHPGDEIRIGAGGYRVEEAG